MFFRTAGAILIVLSSTVAGICFGAKTKYRKEELQVLERAYLMLKNQILFLAMPLPEAMAEVYQKLQHPMGQVFAKTAQLMEEKRGERGEALWQQAVLVWKDSTYLTKEDIEILLSFGTSLGYLDREQQRGNIDLVISYLHRTIETLGETTQQQKKLYSSMGILGGLFLVVVLL